MFQRVLPLICLFVASSAFATEIVQLVQNTYPLFFKNSDHYLVFDPRKARADSCFEWKYDAIETYSNYYLTIRSQDVTTRLISATGETLDFSLYDARNLSAPVTLFNLQNYLQALILLDPPNNDWLLRFPFTVIFPSKQFASPGRYSCFLDLGIYDYQGKIITTDTIQLSAEVAASQKIDVVSGNYQSGNSSIELNFGPVLEPSTLTAQFQAASNLPYQIKVRSMNRGRLLLLPEWRKPHYSCIEMHYTLFTNGKKVNLHCDAAQIGEGRACPGNRNSLYNLSFTVYPDPNKHWEGSYEDEIILSIEPNY